MNQRTCVRCKKTYPENKDYFYKNTGYSARQEPRGFRRYCKHCTKKPQRNPVKPKDVNRLGEYNGLPEGDWIFC